VIIFDDDVHTSCIRARPLFQRLLKDALKIQPKSAKITCGFVAETYRSKQQIPQQALPSVYEGSRPFGSVAPGRNAAP
jgi:hypothetical protein